MVRIRSKAIISEALTVTGDHAHEDTSLVTIGHGLNDVISQRVFDAHNANERETLFLCVNGLGIVLALGELAIGQGKCAKSCERILASIC